jgi:malonyl CoA-acyl carrier protein transacylase
MTSVVVFPGYGSQHKGMGKGLFERFPDLVAQADEILGYSIQELCLNDPQRMLNTAEYAQPALFVVNILRYLDHMSEGGQPPEIVAGHGLGEYCALFAAGGFDFATGLRLVVKCGELTSRTSSGAMAAIADLDQSRVAEIIAELPYDGIDIAVVNGPRLCVLSGSRDELFAADVREAFAAAGATFVPLQTSAAFHSRLMNDVQEEFTRYLSDVELAPLTIPVVANYTARKYPTMGYAGHLAHQVSHPVRWYESISWLMAHGHTTFQEIGPGDVLTRLTDTIVSEPLPIVEIPSPRGPVTASTLTPARPRKRLIFMYGGQGSQYYGMGKELYNSHPIFRGAMDRCSAVYQKITGRSLTGEIYDERKKRATFDDVSFTHAAIFSTGYSLTETLRAEGIHPDGIVGQSMGEYIAATSAGVLTFEDGLRLVTEQGRIAKRGARGGLMCVLTDPDILRTRPELFADVELGGINAQGNFVVGGEKEDLTRLSTALQRERINAVMMPVNCAFHTELLDDVRQENEELAATMTPHTPRIPLYSSKTGGLLDADTSQWWDGWIWGVIRDKIYFADLMASHFSAADDCVFVDMTASSVFKNILKWGYDSTFRCHSVMTRREDDVATLANLRDELRSSPRTQHESLATAAV